MLTPLYNALTPLPLPPKAGVQYLDYSNSLYTGLYYAIANNNEYVASRSYTLLSTDASDSTAIQFVTPYDANMDTSTWTAMAYLVMTSSTLTTGNELVGYGGPSTSPAYYAFLYANSTTAISSNINSTASSSYLPQPTGPISWMATGNGAVMVIYGNGISKQSASNATYSVNTSKKFGMLTLNGHTGGEPHTFAKVAYFWNRVLTTNEMALVAANPWAPFLNQRPPNWAASSGLDTSSSYYTNLYYAIARNTEWVAGRSYTTMNTNASNTKQIAFYVPADATMLAASEWTFHANIIVAATNSSGINSIMMSFMRQTNGNSNYVSYNTSSANGYAVFAPANTLKTYALYQYVNGTASNGVNGLTIVNAQITMRMKAGTISLWYNGVQIISYTGTATIPSGANWQVGVVDTSRGWTYYTDTAYFWTRALSDAEILALGTNQWLPFVNGMAPS